MPELVAPWFSDHKEDISNDNNTDGLAAVEDIGRGSAAGSGVVLAPLASVTCLAPVISAS